LEETPNEHKCLDEWHYAIPWFISDSCEVDAMIRSQEHLPSVTAGSNSARVRTHEDRYTGAALQPLMNAEAEVERP
jgi:hypothetical protein